MKRFKVAGLPAALVAVCLVGLGLRLYNLGGYSLWYDEVMSVDAAQRGLAAIFTDRFGWMSVQTPMHYLIVWLTAQPLDPTVSSWLVRLPSALAGALTVPLTYAVGRELFGRAQGLLAAAIVAFSPVMLDYSQDLRPYSMLAFLTLGSVYCLLRAQHTLSWRWWTAFVLVTLLDMLNAYVAVTLALPALAPYLLWVLWTLRRNRKALLVAFAAMAVVGVAALGVLTDMMQVPRIAPDLRLLSPAALLASPIELCTWLLNTAISGRAGQSTGMALLLLVLAQAYVAVRKRQGRGLLLCGLLIYVPALVLAVLSTTNAVFQRYALFVMPFYALLVANGIMSLREIVPLVTRRADRAHPVGTWLSAAVAGLVVALYALSAYAYTTPDGHDALAQRPDVQSAARYLTEHVKPGDVIVFVGWDPTVSYFYWKGQPPAPAYDISDPRVWNAGASGSVYWMSSFVHGEQDEMAASGKWAEVVSMRQLKILREPVDRTGLGGNLDRMVSLVQGMDTEYQIKERILAAMYEAQGDTARAAQAYRSAGTYMPIGGEYLQTARGFAGRGDDSRAWRDAIFANNMQPQLADIHSFMSDELKRMGYTAESRAEQQLADALQDLQSARGPR